MKKIELCSPSFNHWIQDFCLHGISSCCLLCSNLYKVQPSCKINFYVLPSVIIRCWISAISPSSFNLSSKIFPNFLLFQSFNWAFKSFNFSWKACILLFPFIVISLPQTFYFIYELWVLQPEALKEKMYVF